VALVKSYSKNDPDAYPVNPVTVPLPLVLTEPVALKAWT